MGCCKIYESRTRISQPYGQVENNRGFFGDILFLTSQPILQIDKQIRVRLGLGLILIELEH